MKTKGNTLFWKGWICSILILANVGSLSGQQPVQIVSILPGQNALHVPRNTTISTEFNAEMDAATINERTFIVRGEDSGPHSGVVSYDSTTRTATFRVDKEFFAGELVTVTLTREILSTQGRQPFKGFTWQFTVEAWHATPPEFREGTDLMLGHYSIRAVYTADLDRDRDLDIVAVKEFIRESIVVVRNDGKGNLSQIENYALQGGPDSIFGNDLDNDGYIDLFAATALIQGSIAVLINDGNGSFSQILRFDNSKGYLSKVRGGDINNDGNIDLIYGAGSSNSDSVSGWIGVLLNDGMANFVEVRQYKLRNAVEYLYLADFNSDGHLDIIAGMGLIVGQKEFWNGMAILLNNGDGSFGAPDYYTYMIGTQTIYCNDFDGDGDIDVAVAINTAGVLIYLNDGQGAFPETVDLRYGETVDTIWGADFDGDRDIDLLVTQTPIYPNAPAIRLYLNPGDAQYLFLGSLDIKSLPDIGIRRYGGDLSGGDLDNDGDVDFVVPFHENARGLSFFFNEETSGVEEQRSNSPAYFYLGQNYPNPFNSNTQISYTLQTKSSVKLAVYNVKGEEVITLVDKEMGAGHHQVRWDGKNAVGEEVGFTFISLKFFQQEICQT